MEVDELNVFEPRTETNRKKKTTVYYNGATTMKAIASIGNPNWNSNGVLVILLFAHRYHLTGERVNSTLAGGLYPPNGPVSDQVDTLLVRIYRILN